MLFAVCHRQQQALCRPPRTTKKPRGNHLCFLAADHLVNLPTVADGKGLMLFAVSHGRQRLLLAT